MIWKPAKQIWCMLGISVVCLTALSCASSPLSQTSGRVADEAALDQPPAAQIYTATGSVRFLTFAPGGTLEAVTHGGVLSWEPGVDEARVVSTQDHSDGVALSDANDAWRIDHDAIVRQRDHKRFALPVANRDVTPKSGTPTALAAENGEPLLATSLGFWRLRGKAWMSIPLPTGSTASHVSALCADSHGLFAGLYGDGLYRLSGSRWSRVPGVPPGISQITALAVRKGNIAAGTKDDGVWLMDQTGWRHLRIRNALPDADMQAVEIYHGKLWCSTFSHGLLQLDGPSTKVVSERDGLQSRFPRGMVVWRDQLFVRHASGALDRFDGNVWHPAFSAAELPRPQVYAMASDTDYLYLGGWAGWASTNGARWDYHYHDSELAGQVITAIAARGDSVWIGTQARGLFRYQGGRYTQFHEAAGMTDDWITCLAVHGDRVLAGTYTGGLLEQRGDRFVRILDSSKLAIRTITFQPGTDTAFAATPLGVYTEQAGAWRLIPPERTNGVETQALLATSAGLWIGSRTALAWLPNELT